MDSRGGRSWWRNGTCKGPGSPGADGWLEHRVLGGQGSLNQAVKSLSRCGVAPVVPPLTFPWKGGHSRVEKHRQRRTSSVPPQKAVAPPTGGLGEQPRLTRAALCLLFAPQSVPAPRLKRQRRIFSCSPRGLWAVSVPGLGPRPAVGLRDSGLSQAWRGGRGGGAMPLPGHEAPS